MSAKRLTSKDWKKIERLLKSENVNISKISRDFNVSRKAIYDKAYREGWLTKKKKGFFEKMFGIKFVLRGQNDG